MSLKKLPLIDKNMIVPFWLLTSCFVVWGLAQDLTAPLVTAFKGIFTMSTFEASLVQFAYFGAYFCLALPTAFLNERFGYKVGVLTGLGLAAIGAFGFYPAAKSLTFGFFLIALFILAAGLSVLETSANPFAIAMGPEGTATRRLNLAQSFNPLGTNLGVLLAAVLVLPKMNPATPEQRATMPHDQPVTIQTGELNAIMNPYLGLAVALVIIWIGLFIKKVPRSHEEVASDSHHLHFGDTVRRLHHNHHWRYGVLAQFFNVGAQVCTWTYIVLYVAEVVPGGTAVRGAYFLQISLIVFFISRFVMTWLMGYIRATRLLALMSSIAFGAADLASADVWAAIVRFDSSSTEHLIIRTLRVPRAAVAALVGAALAVAGALMQGLTRNPLADPGILGINAGAGLVAVMLIVVVKDVPAGVIPN